MLVSWHILLLKIAANAAALLFATRLPGFALSSWWAIAGLAVLLMVANFAIPFVILFLSMPLNRLSVAVFTIIGNAGLLGAFSFLVPALQVAGWLPWAGGSLVIGGINFIVNTWVFRRAVQPMFAAD